MLESLEGFKLGVLQSVVQVRDTLKDEGVSWEEFDAWLEDRLEKDARDPDKDVYIVKRNCPRCGFPVDAHNVNTNRSNRVEGNWASMWFCDECGWNEMSELTAPLARAEYRVKLSDEEISQLSAKRRAKRRIHRG